MSDILTLGGISIPVASCTPANDSVGSSGRGANGNLHHDQTFKRRAWDISTPIMPLHEVHALEGFVLGEGHRFSFDTTKFSDKGLEISGGSTSIGDDSVAPVHGVGRLDVQIGTDIEIGYEFWTIAYWYHATNNWVHVIETSDNRQWVDGVPLGGFTPEVDYLDGTLSLTPDYYDDLVILPYEVPNFMGNQWPRATPFAALPRLDASGPLIGRGVAIVQGVDTSTSDVVRSRWNGWSNLWASLSFTLKEV